jgi:hypothetical protein
MQNDNRDHYTIAGNDVIAQGTDLKVSILTLSAGQCVPWHHHSNVSDRFLLHERPDGGGDARAACHPCAQARRDLHGSTKELR